MLRNLNDSSNRFLDIPYDGIKYENIPLTGQDGAAVTANDLETSDAGSRLSAEVVTPPPNATHFFMRWDGSFELEGPIGTHTFTYQAKKQMINVGTPRTVNAVIGNYSLIVDAMPSADTFHDVGLTYNQTNFTLVVDTMDSSDVLNDVGLIASNLGPGMLTQTDIDAIYQKFIDEGVVEDLDEIARYQSSIIKPVL